jgi:hypothetical protein
MAKERKAYKELYERDEEIIQAMLETLFGSLAELKQKYERRDCKQKHPLNSKGLRDAMNDLESYIYMRERAARFTTHLKVFHGITLTDMEKYLDFDMKLTCVTQNGGFKQDGYYTLEVIKK